MAVSIQLASIPSIMLPAGFKFVPTDEEIVVDYLRCRAVNQPLPSAFIIDKEILDQNPWDLVPGSSSEKYFFYHRVKRWATGARWKRAAKDGFWKASGKEVPIFCRVSDLQVPLLVGIRRTLVFYRGKPLAGKRTDWVMQEYRLAGAGLTPYRVTKKHDDTVDALSGTAASIKNSTIWLKPDESWVVCHMYEKIGRTPHDVEQNISSAGEEKIPFFDFLGVGNHESAASSGDGKL
ncbi:hypothetical protein EJB05_27804, partial [Eragrostis curvula]